MEVNTSKIGQASLILGIKKRPCPVCGENRISHFTKHKHMPDGLQSYCRTCNALRQVEKKWKKRYPCRYFGFSNFKGSRRRWRIGEVYGNWKLVGFIGSKYSRDSSIIYDFECVCGRIRKPLRPKDALLRARCELCTGRKFRKDHFRYVVPQAAPSSRGV